MKKSRIAKLALMGASITALAATLTTSTYAWYVSNKTAKVNAVTGSTAEGAADGSISLSTSGAVNEYYKSISLTAAANFNGVGGAVELEPVTTTDGVTFYQPTYSAGSWTQGSAVTNKSFYFKFYIKAAANCTVIPTITVTNTTTSVPTQVNYSGTGTVTGVDNGKVFTIDAINALHMSLVPTPGTAYSSTVETYVAGTAGATQLQAVQGGAKVTATGSSDIAAFDDIATAGAADYFTEIMGYDPYTSDIAYTANAFGNISLLKDTPVMLEYRIWLDGGDDQCFNSCAGQDFSFAFSYTVQG